MKTSPPMGYSCFGDFWQEYLRQHQHPVNQTLHVLGTIGGLTCLILGWAMSWTWLIAVLPVGYGLAWVGHFVIEKNRPLTLTYPLWSLRADWKMVALLLTGRRLAANPPEKKIAA